ncbi:DUF4112 domain-containing protein [uncultured Erythrobacter sp.]|uniref:DUF4112 domain-containing protein n=1 Tax=uncultured Erythrobacter sp. TaxID=263913 RepID=UPI0026311EFC|nr:DUF4112 domain-containing protein [uncultured Erythrobacter sp.]
MTSSGNQPPILTRRTTHDRAGADQPEGLSFALPTGSDPHSVRARVEAVELLLERSFRVPGLNMPIGLDAIIGLIPVIGDIVTTALGAYIVWEARNLGLSKFQLTRMGANVAFDTLLGLVPVVGDAADFLYRSNTKNLRIIKKHLDKHHPETKVIEG